MKEFRGHGLVVTVESDHLIRIRGAVDTFAVSMRELRWLATLPGLCADTSAEMIHDVFAYWQTACGHPRARLTQDRRSKVRARLKEGYTVADLKKACDGARVGAFRDGRGHKWDDLTLICRAGSNVERFMQMAGTDSGGIQRKVLG